MNYDILAIGPHPDDVEIGCSGTLIDLVDRGYRVAIADLTEAALATRGDPLTRGNEAKQAVKIMKIHKRFQLDLKEGSLQPSIENISKLVTLIRTVRPNIMLSPYHEDRHPDHSATSDLVQAASFWAGVARFGDSQPPHRPHRVLNYFLHWEGPAAFIVDISSTFDRKLEAIRCYHTQFLASPEDRSMTYISRPEFLEKIINRARNYGSQIGSEYGEAFYLREPQRVDNLVTWADMQGVVG